MQRNGEEELCLGHDGSYLLFPSPCSYVGFLPRGQCGPSPQSIVLQEQTVLLCVSHEPHLLHHGLLHGLQRNLCPSIWSTSSSSFFTDLYVCRAVAHIFFNYPLCFWGMFALFKVPPSWLKGSAVPSGVSGMEQLGLLFTKAYLQPLHWNLVTKTFFTSENSTDWLWVSLWVNRELLLTKNKVGKLERSQEHTGALADGKLMGNKMEGVDETTEHWGERSRLRLQGSWEMEDCQINGCREWRGIAKEQSYVRGVKGGWEIGNLR